MRDDQRTMGYSLGYLPGSIGYLGSGSHASGFPYEETSVHYPWKPHYDFILRGDAPPTYEEAIRTGQTLGRFDTMHSPAAVATTADQPQNPPARDPNNVSVTLIHNNCTNPTINFAESNCNVLIHHSNVIVQQKVPPARPQASHTDYVNLSINAHPVSQSSRDQSSLYENISIVKSASKESGGLSDVTRSKDANGTNQSVSKVLPRRPFRIGQSKTYENVLVNSNASDLKQLSKSINKLSERTFERDCSSDSQPQPSSKQGNFQYVYYSDSKASKYSDHCISLDKKKHSTKSSNESCSRHRTIPHHSFATLNLKHDYTCTPDGTQAEKKKDGSLKLQLYANTSLGKEQNLSKEISIHRTLPKNLRELTALYSSLSSDDQSEPKTKAFPSEQDDLDLKKKIDYLSKLAPKPLESELLLQKLRKDKHESAKSLANELSKSMNKLFDCEPTTASIVQILPLNHDIKTSGVSYHCLQDDNDTDDYRPECENCKEASFDAEEADALNETMTLQRRPAEQEEDPQYYRTSLTLPTNTKKTSRPPLLQTRESWFTAMQEVTSSSESE